MRKAWLYMFFMAVGVGCAALTKAPEYVPLVYKSAETFGELLRAYSKAQGVHPDDAAISCEHEWHPETRELLQLCTAKIPRKE